MVYLELKEVNLRLVQLLVCFGASDETGSFCGVRSTEVV